MSVSINSLATHQPTEHTYTISNVTESAWRYESYYPVETLPTAIVQSILSFNRLNEHRNFRKTCKSFIPIFPMPAYLHLQLFRLPVSLNRIGNSHCNYDLTNDHTREIVAQYKKNCKIIAVHAPRCRAITPEVLNTLRELPLTSINLNYSLVAKKIDWTFLTGMPLKSLYLHAHVNFNDADLGQIVVLCPNLQNLNLNFAAITNRSVEILTELPLRRLRLGYNEHINDIAMQSLRAISTLTNLSLRSLGISDQGIEYLTDLRFHTLYLEGSMKNTRLITNKTIPHLSKMPLQKLTIGKWVNIDSQGKESLKTLFMQFEELQTTDGNIWKLNGKKHLPKSHL
jgi:hypothetical protein